MTRRILLISSVALTLVVSGFAVRPLSSIAANPKITPTPIPNDESFKPEKCEEKEYRKDHPNKCEEAEKANPKGKKKFSFKSQGKPIFIAQPHWQYTDKIGTGPLKIESLHDGEYKPTNDSCRDTKTLAKYEIHSNHKFIKNENVDFPHDGDKLMAEFGQPGYLISATLTSDRADVPLWQYLDLTFDEPMSRLPDSIVVSYRVSDKGGTSDPDDKGWITLSNQGTVDMVCQRDGDINYSRYKIDRRGKYFQYKLDLDNKESHRPINQRILNVGVWAQPMKKTEVTDTSKDKAKAKDKKKGHLTLVTEKIISDDKKATPSPTGPPLPTPTPSTQVSTSPTKSKTNGVDNDCFKKQKTDPAASVPIGLKQLKGGETKIEDEKTDADGEWTGLDDKVDKFVPGTYEVTFGDFEKDQYKLVAICVKPDDGKNFLRTKLDISRGKASFILNEGKDLEIVALYAPRNLPYISLDKFAVNKDKKIMRFIVPGQEVEYVVRYQNNGAAVANNVVIRDVIPEQYFVSEKLAEESNGKLELDIDVLGRSIISRRIKELKPGEKGSFTIPATLRPTAFAKSENDLPEDSGATPPPTDSSNDSGGTTDGTDTELE